MFSMVGFSGRVSTYKHTSMKCVSSFVLAAEICGVKRIFKTTCQFDLCNLCKFRVCFDSAWIANYHRQWSEHLIPQGTHARKNNNPEEGQRKSKNSVRKKQMDIVLLETYCCKWIFICLWRAFEMLTSICMGKIKWLMNQKRKAHGLGMAYFLIPE